MNKKRGLAVFAAVFTAAVGTVVLQRTFAATGLIYLSPSYAAVQNGANVTVDVRINPGVATDGVEATITYDQAKLQFVSIDSSGSAYPVEFVNSGGSGTVQITRGSFSPVSANGSLIVKVTFQALTGSGSAALGLSANSTSSGNYNNPSVTGTNIEFSATGTILVYRLANWQSRERLFTTSYPEVQNAVQNLPGWIHEGIGFQAYPSSGANRVTVYRMANWITKERLFTTDQNEVNYALAHFPGWVNEGTSFYASSIATSTTVYRLANWKTKERLFTTNSQEVSQAPQNNSGWVYEGIAFYAP